MDTIKVIKNVLSNEKRTHVRGAIAGVVAHLMILILLLAIFLIAKPFVWHAFSSAPYPSSKEPINPTSIEWFVVQSINFISWFVAGIAVGHWSPNNSKAVLVGTVIFLAISTFFASVPNTHSALILSIWALTSPLGIILGYFFYQKRNIILSKVEG